MTEGRNGWQVETGEGFCGPGVQRVVLSSTTVSKGLDAQRKPRPQVVAKKERQHFPRGFVGSVGNRGRC